MGQARALAIVGPLTEYPGFLNDVSLKWGSKGADGLAKDQAYCSYRWARTLLLDNGYTLTTAQNILNPGPKSYTKKGLGWA